MATLAALERVRQPENSPPAQIQNSPTPLPSQRNNLTAEDLFNYLYGYTPIRLVDPVQLQQRQRQAVQLENGASNKQAFSCKYLIKIYEPRKSKISRLLYCLHVA